MNLPVRRGALSNSTTFLGLLVVVGCGAGCLTPSIRYTRNGGSSSGAGSGRTPPTVPVTREYRKSSSLPGDRMENAARGYLGIPYRYGGMSRRGTDCSGLVCMIYRDVARVTLPHSTRKLRTMGRKVTRAHARSGDLVFFRRGMFGRTGHVGVYLRDGIFIHASTKHGVICSNIGDSYYQQRFIEVRRIFK